MIHRFKKNEFFKKVARKLIPGFLASIFGEFYFKKSFLRSESKLGESLY